MAIQIQFRRGTAAEWESVNPILAEGEMGIETDTNLFKIGNGIDQWNDLEYGGLRGFTGSVGFAGSIGNMAVANVLYVSKSGNDLNSGTALNLSKLTIKSALAVATNGTTIFVKSGDYTEDNPLYVPEGVAIVGDNLRTTFVRPANITEDLFWVNNGVYLSDMTFKDHEKPASAVAFPTDGSAGVIHTSPYVQNCTSMTTTGTGMRVDGAHVRGLRSMVVDAYTQYNQGGIGIHHLNRGNSQLVSVFTICCDIAFLCESGGFCSITNSNSSFGNYALKSTGVSEPLYYGRLKGSATGFVFEIDNLVNRPNVGDAVKFEGDPNYYTLSSATPVTSGNIAIQKANFALATPDARNIRASILDRKDKIQVDTIDFLNETYPSFDFDQFKCSRDVGIIIESVVEDMLFGTNYRSRLAGISYYRVSANRVLTEQRPETVAAVNFVKNQVLILIESDSSQGPEYAAISQNFDSIITIMTDSDGLSLAPSLSLPSLDGIDPNRIKAKDILQANRQYIIEEAIAYISETFPLLGYNRETCERDIGLIIDAVGYDLMFGSNFRSITAGRAYYREGAAVVTTSQKEATIASFTYLKSLIRSTVTDDSTVENQLAAKVDIIIDILDQGLTAVPTKVFPEPVGYDVGYENARNLIEANREFIKEETIQYIKDNFPEIGYNRETCERDVGLIVDAVSYDLMFGSNFRTITAAKSYYREGAAVVTTDQKAATVGAFTYLKQELLDLVPGNTSAIVSVTSNMDTIIAVLENGLSSVPTAIVPSPTNYDQGLQDARNLIESNREFIKAEVIAYITANYPGLNYDPAVCQRDIDLILDALYYDLTYGGNLETIIAGRAYYSYNVLQIPLGEKIATLDAYAFMRDLIGDVAQNIDVVELQNTVIQVTGDPGSSQAATTAENLIDLIRTIIDTGAQGTEVAPATSWVAQPLVDAFNTIQIQRSTLQNDVGDYVDQNYFYMTKCRRDIDLILDAMYYDLTYGGNMETLIAARAYYSFSQLQIPNDEKAATLAAYAFMRDLIGDVAQNIDVTELQNIESQVTGLAGSVAAASEAEALVEIIRTTIDTGTAPAEVLASTAWVAQNLVENHQDLQAAKSTIQSSVTEYIEENFAYKKATCARDVGLITDAVCYDLVYGGNSQTADAADEYFSGGVLQIPAEQREATAMTFDYIKSIADDCILNNQIPSLNTVVAQDRSLPLATAAEVTIVDSLFSIVSGLVRDAYTSTVVLEEQVSITIPDNAAVTFHQFSLITSSGHTFEWVGAGTNVNAALPYLGGIPLSENQVVEENNGKVYFTGTDQQGDFRIGNDFVINRNTGTVTGRTFTKSLFAVMTPYILAIGE